MKHTIRKATLGDVGTIAHMMLLWDSELPDHVKQLQGDAAYSEKVALFIVTSPSHSTKVVENEDGEVVGAYTIGIIQGLFCSKPYGILNLVVYPKHRGVKLYGLHLLQSAVVDARDMQLAWLESHPWADAHGMQFVLERLGFHELTRGYAVRL